MNREQGIGNKEQSSRETPGAVRAPRPFVTYLVFLFFYSLFSVPCSLRAEAPPHIEKVQVGLPGGQAEQESARSRNGTWSPVYVKFHAGAEGSGRDRYKVRVETTDTENTSYHYDTPLPALTANQDYFAVGYIRPGSAGSDFIISLLTMDGQSVQGVAPLTREPDKETLGPNDVLYLSVGSRLPGMKRALLANPALANVADDDLTDKKGTIRFAFIDDMYHLPDRWFGYEAADVVVLTTGSESFVKSLLEDESAPQRRKALAEWVRRGGKLVVSVGVNRQLAAELLDKMPLPDFDKMPLINCLVEGTVSCPAAPNLARWVKREGAPVVLQNVEFTKLAPGEGVSVLVSESSKAGGKGDSPVVVEASCGLGRVWLTAFDLDGPPFSTWPDGKAFWTKLQSEFTPKIVLQGNKPQPVQPPQFNPQPGMMPNGDDDPGEPPTLLAEMQRSLENFESVEVVNFGWVALFILIYIVIVGPLDYILLTRVFKKPELTWITFPVIVLSLSVLVYLVAYSMKGDGLRANKIDLVEYDLTAPQQASQQVYGTTWFTLFSPRIQSYTLGVEPAPGWAVPPSEDATAHAVTVAALSNPDLAERAGSSSLFRKPYGYAEDASGLDGVPIPVWSTRTFQASWRAAIDPASPPISSAKGISREANDHLAGEITNQLPVSLQSPTIFYRGKSFAVPTTLAPGQTFQLATLWDNNQTGANAAQWAGNPQALAPVFSPGASTMVNQPNPRYNNGQGYVPIKQPYELMKDLMFHTKTAGSLMNNSGLRPFDQSWRLDEEKHETGREEKSRYRDEIILVGRTPNLSGRAETVATDPGSATRIWLDRLPGIKTQRPLQSGYLAQETYVRVYLPVKPSTNDKAEKP